MAEQSHSVKARKVIRYLALGDSYTIGEGVPADESWPVQLSNRLREETHQKVEVTILATTGWTTGDLIKAVNRPTLDKNHHIVTLLIGVNNQYRGYDLSIFRKEFAELLKHAITFADGDTRRVFVLSVPDYGVTPFARDKDPNRISKEIEEYNRISREYADYYQVNFFDLTEISREAATDSTLLTSDGLHPSGRMYERWVKAIRPLIIEKIQ